MTEAPLSIEEVPEVGPLYAPAGSAAVPTVMILHGAEGAGSGWSHRFAAILAAHGFGAVPYTYGEGDFFGAGDIRDVDIAVILRAGERLASHPRVADLGLLGWSRGGELAMLLGALGGADLPYNAIAAHAPADHVHGAFDAAAFRSGGPMETDDPDAPRAWVWQGHESALTPGTPIAIEHYTGPLFLSVGDADGVWDHRMTLNLAERRRAHGQPVELWVAGGQGHAFDFSTEPELWARLTRFFSTHLAPGAA
ncbi:MAG: alpha/beta hydrolase [Pseudomonadota bacterium]